MMLTGHEKSLPLTFFYPEYEGKKTSPQVYVRDVIRRQQDLHVDEILSRHRQAEEKIRQESSWCKSLLDRRLRMGISECYTTEGTKKLQKSGGDLS